MAACGYARYSATWFTCLGLFGESVVLRTVLGIFANKRHNVSENAQHKPSAVSLEHKHLLQPARLPASFVSSFTVLVHL